ncbi:sensor domain-containing diguanylate cyclase [Ralstonia sp. RL]|uniref:sensor domain-containing diguanylate cyclase n=1 Tax=Ralstonia sp. RL TaxID=1839756 RepID=UPI00257FEE7F|nr:sensor domain-containing diguanylate cyclase [Ralstonia sp. RL]
MPRNQNALAVEPGRPAVEGCAECAVPGLHGSPLRGHGESSPPIVATAPRYFHSPARILFILGIAVFVLHYAAMRVLQRFSFDGNTAALIDSAVLVLVLMPVFHWFMFRPLLHHIQAVRKTNIDLHESITRSEKIVATAFDAIIVIDELGMVRDFNPAAEKMFGVTASEIVGQSVNRLMPEPIRNAHDSYIAAYLDRGTPRIIGKGREVEGLRNNGETFPMELAVTEMRVHGRRIFVATIRDITRRKRDEAALRKANEELERKVMARTAELAKANDELQKLATTDALTKVMNRRQFDTELQRELERARRYGVPFALILFDVDHFKRVNDRFGHLSGDRVLAEMAQLISTETRVNDIFARWGGEEFVLLVHGVDADGALQIAEKLRALVATHAFPHGHSVTASFGVTAYAEGDDSVSIMQRVDQALYRAKEHGRNCTELA